MNYRHVILAVSLLTAACSAPSTPEPASFPGGELVDLSHPYDEATIFWPTSDRFRLEKTAEGITPGGYYYASNNVFTAEHGGTHLDAPLHFAQGAQAVDQIPIERFFGAAVVIDVVAQAEGDADYQITAEDLMASERDQGPIPADAIVLLRTGFSRRWPDAARWLIANRSIRAIGIDTASIDYGQSTLYETHRILFERNIPAFENLTALERLPVRGAFIVALPMKIAGGSGAPLRAVAILPRP